MSSETISDCTGIVVNQKTRSPSALMPEDFSGKCLVLKNQRVRDDLKRSGELSPESAAKDVRYRRVRMKGTGQGMILVEGDEFDVQRLNADPLTFWQNICKGCTQPICGEGKNKFAPRVTRIK